MEENELLNEAKQLLDSHLNDTIEEGYFGRTVAKQLIITF